MSTDQPLVVLGSGGHARVLVELVRSWGGRIEGWVGPDADGLPGVARLGDDATLARLDPHEVQLLNGIGSVADPSSRARVFDHARERGFTFATVVAPTAHVASTARLGEGAQVLTMAVVGAGAQVGANSIVNTAAVVEHDSWVGDHVHISPGALLAGDVGVGERTHVGLGARIIQGVRIGSHCTIGAGAIVLADVPDDSLAVGVPATHRPRG